MKATGIVRRIDETVIIAPSWMKPVNKGVSPIWCYLFYYHLRVLSRWNQPIIDKL